MEQNDVIIYSVKIDQTELVKQAAELQNSIDSLVNEQKKLSESGEKNTATFQENASILRVLKREQADVNRQLDNSVKAFNASNGSISQQRANLSVLTKQYNDMSKEQRENAAVGGALQKQIKALSDELKKNEGAVGDNRRSVGNYEGALTNVLGSLGGFGKMLAGAKTGVLGFNTALSANPLGLVLTVLIPVITAFSKFQPIVDSTNVVLGAINGTIDVLIGRLGRLGDAFSLLLSGDLSGAADALADSFSGLGSEIANAASAGSEYAKSQKEIADQNQLLAIQNAEAEKQITQLTARLKDRTLSEKERLQIAEQIGKIERENFAANSANLQKELKAEENRLRATLKARGAAVDNLKTTQDLIDAAQKLGLQDSSFEKLVAAQVKFTNAERDSLAITERIAVRRNAIIDAENEKRQKAIEARLKAEQELVELQERIEKIFADTVDKEQAEILKKREDGYRKQSELIQREQLKQENQLAESLLRGELTQQDYEQRLLQLKLNSQQQQLAIDNEFYKNTEALELQITQTKIAIKQKETDTVKKLTDEQIKAAQAEAQAVANVVGSIAGSLESGTDLQRGVALTNVAVNLGTAISNLVATTSAPSPDNLATGGISGFVKYAAFLTQVVSSIAQARNIIGGAAAGGGTFRTKGPTLMLVGDNPGGVEQIDVKPISGRGKTVVNPKSNLVAMAGGGSLIADGGAASNRASQPIRDVFNLKDVFSSLPAPILKVTDLNRVQSNRAATVKVSELS